LAGIANAFAAGKLADYSGLGYYKKDSSGAVVGTAGYGWLPPLDMTPYAVGAEGKMATIMLGYTCKNACGYCVEGPMGYGYSDSAIQRALTEIYRKTGVKFIKFADSDLFVPERIKFFRDFFESVESDGGQPSIFKTCFLDPSRLLQRDFKDFLPFLLRHGFSGFYFARGAVTESIAEKIGVKLTEGQVGPKIKSQEQLGLELEALEVFIYMLRYAKGECFAPSDPYRVTISYMLTPFETRESIEKMLSEMQRFSALSDAAVKVDIQLSILTPYPGTRVREDNIEDVYEPENFAYLSQFSNAWSYNAAVPAAVLFLDRVLKSHDTYGGIYVSHLMAEAGRVFSGKIDPSQSDKRNRRLGRGVYIRV
jgi:hypothetical protein